jgi:PAS domain S-box-containing protein
MPYRTLENKIDGVVITFSDVTAGRARETTLRERVDEFRAAATVLSLGWGCRPDGAWDYLSPQWVDYTGVPEQDQFGDGWLAQIHPEDRDRARAEWRAAVDAEHPYDQELRIRSRDGKYRRFRMCAVAIRDTRNVVQKWYGTSSDVDELRRTGEKDRAS